MATKIIDLDLAAPLPSGIRLGDGGRAWVVGWRSQVPVGSELVEALPGERLLADERLAQAAAGMARQAELPPAAAGPLPGVSVIICTRGRPDRLPVALASLREQTLAEFELVIVDNAPTDDATRRVVQARWPEARYVVEPVPGLPRARNAGVRAATGEVLAFTDDDCRVVPVWVETFARAFAADRELGCVTGPILPMELATPAQEAMEARGGFNRGWRRRRWSLNGEAGGAASASAAAAASGAGGRSAVFPVQAWEFGAGGSFALGRECALALGGFDEALSRSEDLDIFYRTLRAGFALAFEPGAAVRHRHLPEWSQLARRLFDWGWGYLALLDKVARGDEAEYAARARLERRNWLGWQLRQRVPRALRGAAEVPGELVAREIAGGLVGYHGYPRARAAAERRARRHGSRAVCPPPVPGLFAT